jgi:starvation-inducible DNA-binding protein
VRRGRQAALITPTDFGIDAAETIAASMDVIVADAFALYLKPKNFYWHLSGARLRDYHLLLDEQADQRYAMTDPIAERIRSTGGSTLRSIGHIAKIQRVLDNDAHYVDPLDLLREDNAALTGRFSGSPVVVDGLRDIATASLIENWIAETARRAWFLSVVDADRAKSILFSWQTLKGGGARFLTAWSATKKGLQMTQERSDFRTPDNSARN